MSLLPAGPSHPAPPPAPNSTSSAAECGPPLYYTTKLPFRGDPVQHQLTFDVGMTVEIDPSIPEQNGWVWGSLLDSSGGQEAGASGWLPASYLCQAEDPPSNVSQRRLKLMSKKVGDSMRRGWLATASAARQAGSTVQGVAVESTHRFRDMNEQRKGMNQKQQQQLVDTGNYAARGAVVGAAWGFISGRGVATGATRGAVLGGAHGFVKDWSPFR